MSILVCAWLTEVATRLEYVVPAVLRASFVLFSVTYSYSVVAFAMYCDTPLGMLPLGDVKDHSMMQRWVLCCTDTVSYVVGEFVMLAIISCFIFYFASSKLGVLFFCIFCLFPMFA